MAALLLAYLSFIGFIFVTLVNADETISQLRADILYDTSFSVPSYQELYEQAFDMLPWIIDVRRELHKHPELMFDEIKTNEIITDALTKLDISFTTRWGVNTKKAHLASMGMQSGDGGTGIVAEIGNGKSPCILLRADFDALPITESPGLLPFNSEEEGKMHACGHDAHASMLLGAAAILKRREQLGGINGTIRLIWQPAEEGGAGGKRMVEEGVLSKPPTVDAAFGFHQWPFMPLGTIGAKSGAMMAACDLFDILVSGVGGHAAMPNLVVDPIVAASAIVGAIQPITSRETDPLDASVISVTKFNAGSAYNVIPDGAMIGGTLRSLSVEGLEKLKSRLTKVATSIGEAHQCNVSITFMPDNYPPVMNDESLYQWGKEVVSDASVVGKLEEIAPTMGGEDFAFMSLEVPSLFLALGQGEKEFILIDKNGEDFGPLDTTVTLHNSKFVMNEGLLQRGMALHAHLALQRIHYLNNL